MANDTFRRMKPSINRGVTAISLKTSSSLEKMKIKTHIESIDTEIEKLYVVVGRTAYEIWEADELDFSSLTDQFKLISEKKKEIAQLELDYSSINQRDSQILGSSTPDAAHDISEPEIGIICSKCGMRYTTPVNFCRKCGNKLGNS